MAIDRSAYKINIETSGEFGSVREGREQFHLLKLAAGEALGPIGELIHFLESPALLAFAGITLAIKMLIEQQQKSREETLKGLTASQQFHDFLTENHNKALQDAAEQMHKWVLEIQHAHDNVDRLSDALSRFIAQGQESLHNTDDLIDAQERLAQAIIHAREAAGQITPAGASEQERQAHEAAQHARDAAEDHEKEMEIRAKRDRASDAAGESGVASSRLSGLNEDSRVNTEALGLASNAVETARATSEEATKAALEAKAKLHGAPDPLDVAKAFAQGKNPSEMRAGFVNDAKEKGKAAEQAKQTLETAVRHEASLQSQKDTIDQEIASQLELIKARNELRDKLREEADAAEESLHAHQAGRAQVEAVNRQTDAVNRRAENEDMARRVESGGGTAAEQQQVADWHSQAQWSQASGGGLDRAASDARAAMSNARSAVQAGHGNTSDLHDLMNEFLGLAQDMHASAIQRHEFSGLVQEVENLRSRVDNQSLNPRP